ncbi:MAG TPA: DNA-processing protein DprA, partial [Anaerolineaceae bacterium]
ENVLRVRSGIDLERTWEQIHQKGIQVLIREDEGYPARLKQIDQAPPVLYVRGQLLSEDGWAVAIVGTRRVTVYGRQVTEEIATCLAANGVVVVSGLARGVDAIAHDAALNAGGRTYAVLGSGVDRIYPPENTRLAERITGQGALISDYAPGTPPDGVNFPPRNRIISGLSTAVVVIEAGETSGALITASFAGEQGRDVYAVPGNIHAPQSIGANRLIQQGAHPLLRPEDLLEELDLRQVPQQRAARTALPADAVEAKLYAQLGKEPIHVDEIRQQTGLPIEIVSATLTVMELKGMVRQVGPMAFVVARERLANYDFDG